MENQEFKKTETEVTGAPSSVKNNSGAGFKKMLLPIIVLALLAGGAFGAYRFGFLDFLSKESESTNSKKAVAIVNGETITRADFDERVEQTTEQYRSQGVDVTSITIIDQIKNQTIESMIDEIMLMQAASSAGIVVTAEDVSTRYGEIVEQFGGQEVVNQMLIEQNLTEEKVLKDIKQQLTIERYLLGELDTASIVISDEEVQEAYDQYSLTQDDLPPYEEIAEPIRQDLEQQRINQMVMEFLNNLRQNTRIDILL